MKKYVFYDSGIDGTEEYDIAGESYQLLLSLCFQYCHTVSFCLSMDCKADLSPIEEFRISVTPFVKENYQHYGLFHQQDVNLESNYRIVHYLLSDEVKKFVQKCADSMFQWTFAWGNHLPDDPCFFREDGSVFFSSLIHEGECTLTPRENENISEIIEDERWIPAYG